jgi:hypothetical protein
MSKSKEVYGRTYGMLLTGVPCAERLATAIPVFRRFYRPNKKTSRGYNTYWVHLIIQTKSGAPIVGQALKIKLCKNRTYFGIRFRFPLEGDMDDTMFPKFSVYVYADSDYGRLVSKEVHDSEISIGKWYTIPVSLP